MLILYNLGLFGIIFPFLIIVASFIGYVTTEQNVDVGFRTIESAILSGIVGQACMSFLALVFVSATYHLEQDGYCCFRPNTFNLEDTLNNWDPLYFMNLAFFPMAWISFPLGFGLLTKFDYDVGSLTGVAFGGFLLGTIVDALLIFPVTFAYTNLCLLCPKDCPSCLPCKVEIIRD